MNLCAFEVKTDFDVLQQWERMIRYVMLNKAKGRVTKGIQFGKYFFKCV